MRISLIIFITVVFFLSVVGALAFQKKNTKVTNTVKPSTKPTITPSITPQPTLSERESESTDNIQILKATYELENGFLPTKFKVRAGIPVRLEVRAKDDGEGCMASIFVPGLDNNIQVFVKNETNIFEFTPNSPGVYVIACAMGIPHGYITVE